MRIAFPRVLMTCALTAAILLSTAADAAENTGKIPRLPNGKPNLSGIWQTINTAHYDLEPHSARAALALVPGQFVPVPAPQVVALGAVGAVPAGLGVVEGNTIPYKPEMLKKKQANQQNWLALDPEIKCYLPGIPRANYMPFPFQISHNQDYLFFAYEYAGAVRNVYLKDPGEPPTESWMGQSVGRWDGDTMVIDVSGFNDQTWFDRSGNFHSAQLRVVERFSMRSADLIWYEATITDPEVFTRPWKIRMPLYRRMEPNAQLMQFKCVEFVEELMYGDLRKKPSGARPEVQKE